MTCKTCKWFGVGLTPSGVRCVHRDGVYPCHAPVPHLKAILPASVIGTIDKRFMSGGDGKDCPTYSQIEKVKP